MQVEDQTDVLQFESSLSIKIMPCSFKSQYLFNMPFNKHFKYALEMSLAIDQSDTNTLL